ncbi:MAG: glycosyltransferase family 9 protein [Calditrichaceae bacterium]
MLITGKDSTGQIDPAEIKKILIIQFQPFGDVILSTTYLKALSEKFPTAKIDFLVRKPYDQVLFKNPYLNRVITEKTEKGIRQIISRIKLFLNIKSRKYDLIIDQQNNPGSGQAVLFSNAKYRLGWADADWKFTYNLRAPRGPVRYNGSRKFDILTPLGITEQPYELFFHIKEESHLYIDQWLANKKIPEGEFICISPGSPVWSKRWHEEGYAGLADLIINNTDYNVILLWGPSEKDIVDEIARRMQNKPVTAPKTDFNQAGALISKSALFICNDGGLNHLSVALKTPTLAIFGYTKTDVWSPASVFSDHHHLQSADKAPGPFDPSFGITPEAAFNRILDIIRIKSIEKSQ